MNLLKKIACKARGFLVSPLLKQENYSSAVCQLQLKLAYKLFAESKNRLPGIDEVGFKVFSQTDEDGILLYIFSIIGAAIKKSVEICAGDGIECNTANLIINHGWHGLLVDGNETLVKEGQEFYKKNIHTWIYPPVFVHSWITRDNVNEIIKKNGFMGEIDLLSIDMDGMDYWIWEAISVINPRVVVIEYQDIIGPDKALTAPYKDDFNAYTYPLTRGMPNFCGASLPALVKLAKKKNYRLVGCNKYGYNAFFIRYPFGEKEIPEIPIQECFKHPKVLWGIKERFLTVKDFPWVEV
ncbi:MAG: hypothetical protein WC592_04520 [Candidatus Omnitrophota bacterium]